MAGTFPFFKEICYKSRLPTHILFMSGRTTVVACLEPLNRAVSLCVAFYIAMITNVSTASVADRDLLPLTIQKGGAAQPS